MEQDFNKVRLQAIYAYNRLCRVLSDNIKNETITVKTIDIIPHIYDLQNALVTIGSTSENGNDNFKCILTEDIKIEWRPITFNLKSRS